MHPAIQNQSRAVRFEIVRVCADLSMSGEIGELHVGELFVIFLFRFLLILILILFLI
jgi:hypothetical protein